MYDSFEEANDCCSKLVEHVYSMGAVSAYFPVSEYHGVYAVLVQTQVDAYKVKHAVKAHDRVATTFNSLGMIRRVLLAIFFPGLSSIAHQMNSFKIPSKCPLCGGLTHMFQDKEDHLTCSQCNMPLEVKA